jgi:hypothetical protein
VQLRQPSPVTKGRATTAGRAQGSRPSGGKRREAARVGLPDISRFLLPAEEVRYVDRRHPIVLVGPVAIAIMVCIVGGLIVAAAGAGPIVDMYVVLVIGALGWLAYRVIKWSRVVLVATNRRVFEIESLVIRRATIRPVFRQGVIFIQDPLGERLNFGTILTMMPNGERVNTFKWTHNPRRFYQAVTDKAV